MAGWFGLSPSAPIGPSGGGGGLRTAPGLVTKGQLLNPAAAQPASPKQILEERGREPVVLRDLHPTGNNTYHTLRDFCTLQPGMSPQTMDMLFFHGKSPTSRATTWTGAITNMLGRSATSEFSHVGIAYVGADREVALFEAVREIDTLRDILSGQVGASGVRLVRLSDRIVKYARNGEYYSELPNLDRVVRVGVMPFRVPEISAEALARVMAEICRRFDAIQDRLAGVSYTNSTKELCQAQLPQIFGTNPVTASDTAMFCSKLTCIAYQATGILNPNFNPSAETPSTLAARTLPIYRAFTLGPDLYNIYICVKRIEWDAELQLVMFQQQKQREATLAAAQYTQHMGYAGHHQQQLQQRPPPPAAVASVPQPAAAAAVPLPPVPTITSESPLFLDTVDEGLPYDMSSFGDDGYDHIDPEQGQSVEQMLRLANTDSEVFRRQSSFTPAAQGEDDSFILSEVAASQYQYASQPAAQPPPPPLQVVPRPDIAEEDQTLAWMNKYG